MWEVTSTLEGTIVGRLEAATVVQRGQNLWRLQLENVQQVNSLILADLNLRGSDTKASYLITTRIRHLLR